SLRPASCWSVEVVNGGAGKRCAGFSSAFAYNLHTPGLRKALGLQSIDFQIMCENLAVWMPKGF
ncbi:hypothetical protein NE555_17615, partial [Alistipes onderdonkii]|uniref:hypothetical protein n=1 Tax=Alistipes onderdonkii TaxID=328813 RepID=UPI002109AA8C